MILTADWRRWSLGRSMTELRRASRPGVVRPATRNPWTARARFPDGPPHDPDVQQLSSMFDNCSSTLRNC
jgi:hypothetical protein